MNETTDTQKLAESFVGSLLELSKRKDRGRLADLRRGLSPATEHQAWSVLGGLGGFRHDAPVEVYQTVAALYALHPKHAAIGNFGVTCSHVAKGREEAFERRFRRLLACATLKDLCAQLPTVVKMAKSSDMSVDYTQLFKDLRAFDHDPRRIKVNWAGTFWSAPQLADDGGTGEGVKPAKAQKAEAKQ